MDISKIFPFLFINECVICGKEGEGTLCSDCAKTIFVKGKSKTLMGNTLYFLTIYDGKGERIVREIKSGKVSLIPYLVDESLKILKDEDFDIITAVPSIGFIFSFIPEHLSLLAKGISLKRKINYISLIEKVKRVKSQTLLPPEEKLKNPIGAFKLKYGGERFVKNKKILIIDDVYTTGATMRECEKEIMKVYGIPISLVVSKSTFPA